MYRFLLVLHWGLPWPDEQPARARRVVHKLPADLRKVLIANGTALAAWKDITPLARNEFICWVEDAKQAPRDRWQVSVRGMCIGHHFSTVAILSKLGVRNRTQAAAYAHQKSPSAR